MKIVACVLLVLLGGCCPLSPFCGPKGQGEEIRR